MKLIDLINRPPVPQPWSEGDNIPWHEPAFSERMLHEHLTQNHDAASRRTEKIERHVAWIHKHVLANHQTRILDLGCGPGLYASRLARLGHECTGIDLSPASIRYARAQATQDSLTCTYLFEDIRTAAFGSSYGLVMLIYGEFNVFKPADARAILNRAHEALAPGGTLLLEPSTFDDVRKIGAGWPSWYSSRGGLFSAEPHMVLTESFWNEGTNTTRRGTRPPIRPIPTTRLPVSCVNVALAR
jgi:SAM-dependent methyltransferase